MIEYRRFNPHLDDGVLDPLANCYRQVFATSPWNEWRKCGVCKAKWGITEIAPPKHCDQPVVEFWPAEVVCQDIISEITDEATCWLAITNNRIVGFTWGYPINLDSLEQKIQLPGIAEAIRARFGRVDLVGYHDEIGVIAEYRGQKIGKELQTRRLTDFHRQGLTVGVSRTKTRPPTVTYLWYTQRLGYNVLAKYDDDDGRVILAGLIKLL